MSKLWTPKDAAAAAFWCMHDVIHFTTYLEIACFVHRSTNFKLTHALENVHWESHFQVQLQDWPVLRYLQHKQNQHQSRTWESYPQRTLDLLVHILSAMTVLQHKHLHASSAKLAPAIQCYTTHAPAYASSETLSPACCGCATQAQSCMSVLQHKNLYISTAAQAPVC